MISEWQASIAQVDLADWVTVFAYLLAAMLSVRAAAHAKLCRGRESAFWRSTAVLLILLGVNELLDLQTLLTSAARENALANGWYGERRPMQGGGGHYRIDGGDRPRRDCTVLAHQTRALGCQDGSIRSHFHRTVRSPEGRVVQSSGRVPRSQSARVRWGSLQEMGGIIIVAASAVFYIQIRPPTSTTEPGC